MNRPVCILYTVLVSDFMTVTISVYMHLHLRPYVPRGTKRIDDDDDDDDDALASTMHFLRCFVLMINKSSGVKRIGEIRD